MADMIVVNELYKSYAHKKVLRGVSFSVKPGEIYGLLGVNGAGKTTTMEIIEDLRKQDSGNVQLNGKIGVQLQRMFLPTAMTVKEAMKLYCAWHKVPYRGDLLQRFQLSGEYLTKHYYKLSTGCKLRLHIALALCDNPDILILDEPTAGLDVEGRISLRNEIIKLKNDGKSILMTTHDVAEAEEVCDRIGILHEGMIAKEGTPLELTASINSNICLSIKTRNNNEYVKYYCTNISEFLLDYINELKTENDEIVDMKIERASVEDVFLSIVGGAK